MYKEAKRGIYWHGTSSNNLRSILKQGLTDAASRGQKRIYEDEYQGSQSGSRSIKTYGGIYFSTDWFTAYAGAGTASRKVGGNSLIIGVDLETKSPDVVVDEDEIIPRLTRAIGGSYLPEIVRPPKFWHNTFYPYIDFGYMGGGINRDKLGDLLIAIEQQDMSEAVNRFISSSNAKVQNTYSHNKHLLDSLISRALKDLTIHLIDAWFQSNNERNPYVRGSWQRLNNSVTALSKKLKGFEESEYYGYGSENVRSLSPLKFSGKNKIILIAEIIEDRGVPGKIIFHYGKSHRYFFLNEYKTRVGEYMIIDPLNKEAKSKMSSLKSRAKSIDDSFHDVIIELRERGDTALSNELEKLQGESHSLLNEYLGGEHPNNKYYKNASFEEDENVYENSYKIDEEFLEHHGILGEDLGWLGSGDNGDAYTCGDGRVLKVTKSGAEYGIAKRLIGSKYDGIVEYFAAEKVGGSYYILMEELDPIDDYEFTEAVGMLESQGLSVTYLDHFDEDEYEESHGEAPDMSFLNELWEVLFDLRKAGIGDRADIRAENLGRDSSGKLKAFDVMERV